MTKRRSLSDFEDSLDKAIFDFAQREYEKRARHATSEQELTRILEKIGAAITESIPIATRKNGRHLAGVLDRKTPAMLRNRRRLFRDFERRLRKTWEESLDRFEALVHTHVEYGEMFAREVFSRKGDRPSFVHIALARLHARSCRLGLEICALLKAGLSDGAHARWRTLHEVATVSLFLAQSSEETAERYLLHKAIRQARAAEAYQRHCKHLGYRPLTKATLKRMEDAKTELLTRFGSKFSGEYGWAAEALGPVKPSFAALEEQVLPHWRPFFGWASSGVHAGPDGLDPLGLQLPPWIPFLPGPSNAGLADPGWQAARSIAQICAAMNKARPTLTRATMTEAMVVLAARCEAAFMRGHRKVEALRKSDLRKQSRALQRRKRKP